MENAIWSALQQWREACPELVVRSTFIAGFPGETEEEFEHLLDFVREAQIDRAGCFAYSAVNGATANDLPGMLPIEVARRAPCAFHGRWLKRYRLRGLQRRVGSVMQVLVDSAPGMGRKGAEWGVELTRMRQKLTAWYGCCRPRKSARR